MFRLIFGLFFQSHKLNNELKMSGANLGKFSADRFVFEYDYCNYVPEKDNRKNLQ